MHSCITTLVLILATLSSARYLTPYEPNSWALSDMERVDGCIDLSSSLGAWPRGAHIFFNSPSEPNFNFVIATVYNEFYPGTLTNMLQANGFITRHASSIPESELYGWWNAGEARLNGRVHGGILWKYSDLRRKTAVPDFGNSTSWEASSKDHIPPHLDTRPNDRVLNLIHSILIKNVPNADIYYSWTTALGFTCGMLGTLLFFATLKSCVENKPDSDNSADIELDEIRVHRLSGSSMQRMDTNNCVKTPSFKLEITKPDGESSSSSNSASIADPPPIYTVNGTGR